MKKLIIMKFHEHGFFRLFYYLFIELEFLNYLSISLGIERWKVK